MSAFVGIKLGLGWLPAWIPYGIAVFYIEVFAIGIIRNIIITITCQTKQLRILIESISTTGIGYQGKEFITSQIVDPGKRSFGSRDDVFTVGVIEITKFHIVFSFTIE